MNFSQIFVVKDLSPVSMTLAKNVEIMKKGNFAIFHEDRNALGHLPTI